MDRDGDDAEFYRDEEPEYKPKRYKTLTKAQQKKLIKQIIRRDANITGDLTTGKVGQYCVIGGIAHYGCKVPQHELVGMETDSAFPIIAERFPILVKVDKEGILKDTTRVNRLVCINDSYEPEDYVEEPKEADWYWEPTKKALRIAAKKATAARRKALLKYVDRL